MNMLVHKEGFGMRSSRYSAFINNGEVVKMFVEDGNQFKVSDVNTMLEYLKSK